MPAPVTQEDIAHRAGVNRSTVSLALRDSPRISEERRRDIQALAAAMGYRANPLVTALMRTRRNRRPAATVPLAFLTNYPSRFGWRPSQHTRPDFFPGAARRGRELGYELEHFWLAEPGMTPERMDDILQTRGIRGVLLARLPPGQERLDFPWERYSCLALGMTLREPRLHRVTENHFDTLRRAFRQCRAYGYRRIGLVFSESDDSPSVGNRWRGAFLASQWDLPPSDRVSLCPRLPPSFPEFRQWFREERPDALIATHAAPVLDWLQALEVSVPADLGLVELQPANELSWPGVDYDPADLGSLAVDMLVSMLQRNEVGIPENPHEVLVSGSWRDGWSLPDRRSPAR